jgi:outer membrane murein-binding lipoprotein Lpp
MSPTMTPYGLDIHINKSRYSLHRLCELMAVGLVYASVVGLTGCATSAELESLRAEVAKANATALQAEAEVHRTQRELAALKAAAKPPETLSKPGIPQTAPSTKPGGYKWGIRERY